MKLTRASSYALQAVHYIALQKEPKPVASHVIAEKRKIPDRFLLKVLKPLVAARVLRSIKGPHGGYTLAKKPSEITMLEIIEAADNGKIQGLSPLGPKEGNKDLNKSLENICSEAAEVLRAQLGKVKMSDLIANKHANNS